MRLLHTAAKTRVAFDDPNLVSHAGLVPAVRLAENIGLEYLVGEHVQVAARVGVNPGLKVGSLVAGMIAGVDDIDGMDLLRHGAIPATFGGIRAPSTLGSFLRVFDHGNVRQLAAVHRRVLARLAEATPLLAGADTLAFIDVDSVQRRVYGARKQGAAFGHAKIGSKSLLVRGLNALVATVSTPLTAPVVTTARLRGGNAASARGAASLVGRGHRHRPPSRGDGHARGAGRLGLLHRGVHHRLPPRRGALLSHRPDGPQDPPHPHHHRRARLGADPVPERDLRRPSRPVGLRRRDR
jgi:hypothetical protein